MRTGRPNTKLGLSEEERERLSRWARRPTSAQALTQRSRIILECAAGKSNTEVGRDLGVTPQTVGKWRQRFLNRRLEGLLDKPRPGTPRRLTAREVERVLKMTLESTPPDGARWTTRSMAQASGLSRSSVNRIWRSFALTPHRTGTAPESKDPPFVERVQEIVGLYLSPPDRVLALSVVRNSGTAPVPSEAGPASSGGAAASGGHTGDGSLALAALEVKIGRATGRIRQRHRSLEFRRFLDGVDRAVPVPLDVHLILDSDSAPMIHRWLVKRPRFQLHFAPTGTSWVNMVDRWLVWLTERQVHRRAFPGKCQLERAIRDYMAACEEPHGPFAWSKAEISERGQVS